LGEHIDTIQKNIEALLDASKEVALVVKSEKTKYMLMSHYSKSGQKHSIKIANRSFEDVAKFKYLRTTLTDQKCTNEEIKNRLILGTILSSRLLPKNVKFKISKTIIFPVVLYWCETRSLALREEYMLRVFENRVLRRIFGPKWDEVVGERRKLHKEELHILYSFPNIIRQIKSRRMMWAGHVAHMERRGMCTTWKTKVYMGGWDQNGS
jgi:hypothetical protein